MLGKHVLCINKYMPAAQFLQQGPTGCFVPALWSKDSGESCSSDSIVPAGFSKQYLLSSIFDTTWNAGARLSADICSDTGQRSLQVPCARELARLAGLVQHGFSGSSARASCPCPVPPCQAICRLPCLLSPAGCRSSTRPAAIATRSASDI